MTDWKKMFTRLNLERGEELYESGCVDSLDDKDNVYTATVKDSKHSYRTLAVIDEEELVSLKCNCQTSMNGSRCKHMASLLFEIEDEYAMEIFPKQERKKKKNEEQITLTFEDDGKPHYLSFKDTLSRYYVYAKTYNKALKIYEKGNYEIDDEWIGADRKGNKELYFYVNVYENRHNAKVSIHLGRYGIGEVDCLDDDSWFESSVYDECLITRPDESGKIELCVHKTVAFLVLFDYIRKNRDKVDYSDSQARNIISSFRKELNYLALEVQGILFPASLVPA